MSTHPRSLSPLSALIRNRQLSLETVRGASVVQPHVFQQTKNDTPPPRPPILTKQSITKPFLGLHRVTATTSPFRLLLNSFTLTRANCACPFQQNLSESCEKRERERAEALTRESALPTFGSEGSLTAPSPGVVGQVDRSVQVGSAQ